MGILCDRLTRQSELNKMDDDHVNVAVPDSLLESLGQSRTWSDAVRVGQFVFCTGQVGWSKKTGQMARGGIEAQTRQALENLREVLATAGASLADVVTVRVYLLTKEDHDRYDPIYQEFFAEYPPARLTVVVKDLIDRDSLIDIEAVAIVRAGNDRRGSSR